MLNASFLNWLGFGQKRCLHCATPYFSGETGDNCISESLCPACQNLFVQYTGSVCQYCGVPTSAEICPACKRAKPLWQSLAYFGLYDGPLRNLLLRLKFSAEIRLTRLLAEFLLQACQILPKPDLLIPIPQHYSRLYERGYNQTHEIARQFAQLSTLPFKPALLSRIKPGIAQEALTAKERRLNLRDAFTARPEVCNTVIWLIDDTLTTGSTCNAATKALGDAGAKAVHVLTVARTPLAQAGNRNDQNFA